MIELFLCEARRQIRSIVGYVRNLESDALVQKEPIRTISRMGGRLQPAAPVALLALRSALAQKQVQQKKLAEARCTAAVLQP